MKFALACAMVEPSHLLPLARSAEAAGFDSITMPDSVFYPRNTDASYPYSPNGERFWDEETPFVDPWVAIPAMAAVTERIDFFTNVLKAPLREPLLLAKTVSSAAAMAPGRIGVGVGLSWIPEEFEWLNQDMRTRGARLDEIIQILRATMSGQWTAFQGRHYCFGELMIKPAPGARVPIFVGGHSEPALRRAARLGDGWISVVTSPEELAITVDRLDTLRGEYARDTEPFEIVATPLVGPDPDGFKATQEAGATNAITVPWYLYPGDSSELRHQLESIERFAQEVIQPFRST
ncbi:MAG: TIGR03619 family F420-dependent LLM class oxidoreductase [Actinobacteria bacterium]|nr:TIGR03619 family F420-dependent LLM class oxidoreductase [Actinomycetota bacterium]MCB9389027.1 TIGR03619 family F420-dependent LLM class oxidoreductase [Acidimicrobiia bacterium]